MRSVIKQHGDGAAGLIGDHDVLEAIPIDIDEGDVGRHNTDVRTRGDPNVPSGCWNATWMVLSSELATTMSSRPLPVRSAAAIRVGR